MEEAGGRGRTCIQVSALSSPGRHLRLSRQAPSPSPIQACVPATAGTGRQQLPGDRAIRVSQRPEARDPSPCLSELPAPCLSVRSVKLLLRSPSHLFLPEAGETPFVAFVPPRSPARPPPRHRQGALPSRSLSSRASAESQPHTSRPSASRPSDPAIHPCHGHRLSVTAVRPHPSLP